MAEKLTEVELDGIQLHEARPRTLERDSSILLTQEDDIETALGTLHVVVQGNRHKPAIITYHDIGLNSTTNFQGFFNHPDMQIILRCFCVYHVNAPGQHSGALSLPLGAFEPTSPHREQLLSAPILESASMDPRPPQSTMEDDPTSKRSNSLDEGYVYPSMDQLSDMLIPVLQYYSIKSFIGFGVGTGANILCRFSLAHPDRTDGLVLVNSTASKPGWAEWGYQKLNMWHLKGGHMTQSVEDYLLWHWFGEKTLGTNHDLVSTYSEYVRTLNPANLGMFIESYVRRTDLGIVRELDPMKKKHVKSIKCRTMLVSGDHSPHLSEVLNMNSRLDPVFTDWMKFDCGGMVLEEQPDKMAEAFRLFLQGLGYVPSLSQVKLVESRHSLMCARAAASGRL